MDQEKIFISLDFTPNPNTLKYQVNQELLSHGSLNVRSEKEAKLKSPLAFELFQIKGMSGVMLGRDFITITKSEESDWDAIHREVSEVITEHLANKKLIIYPEALNYLEHQGGDSEVEQKIKSILDHEIRPAVAMDGGDITFEKYENGIVYLYLQGACSGCPSSAATLKMGIEARLKEIIPEIQEVVAI